MDKVYHQVRLKVSTFLLSLVAMVFLSQHSLASGNSTHKGFVGDAAEIATRMMHPGNSEMISKPSLANGFFSFLADQPSLAAGAGPVYEPQSEEEKSLLTTLSIITLVLVAIVLLLLFIAANLSNLIRQREGKETLSFGGVMNKTWQMLLNPYINGVAMLCCLIVGLFIIVPIARGVGHHEGYTPTQPIKFSHKIHAGDWKIDCQYCHIGASRGKYATIPSTNICMNCHKAIRSGQRWGETEIAKVIASSEKNERIEWTRIHNLPDLAYFNHQQHVVVGKVACQTCHGPVQEIDYPMYQFNRLSMGWCVNCHRKTPVDVNLYKALGYGSKMDPDRPLVVADIGGLDCVRCHY